MKKYSEENDDFKYLLNVIDTFSKYVWIEPLKDKTGKSIAEAFENIIEEYNMQDIHRTIGMRPIDVSKENEIEILVRLNKQNKCLQSQNAPKFKIGDRVRIYAYKKVFNNKYKKNWTREIFIIDKIFYTNPITYSIKAQNGEEVIGKFYTQELLKTKF